MLCNKKVLLISSVALSILCFAGYHHFFAAAPSPVQLEYLPVSQSQHSAFTGVANAAEPEATVTGESTSTKTVYTFSEETVGAQPQTFSAAVGNWIIGKDDDNTVLVVDGRKWKRGIASAGLADKAKALYGKRYAEFLDNVTAYAYFPFAVAGGINNFTHGTISVRFKAIAGRIDQGAGILFDLKPNGDYYALRANPLENNLVLWRFKQGKRSSVTWVRHVDTPSRKWHTLQLTVKNNKIKGFVNGKHYLSESLPQAVKGKVGLWTKADSVVYFDDYTVLPE
jgi:hypothetical protein